MGLIRKRSWKASANGAMAGRVKPLARTRDLIIEELEGEVLIYDENSNTAHNLSTEAADVWRACDGRTTIDALTADTDLDADTVTRALAELYSRGLLEDGESGAALTRRDLGLRVAKVGGAVAAAPLIVSVMPAVAQATMTPTIEDCLQYNAESCSGCDEIIGCCCCCQGSGDCKQCFPETLCPSFDCNLGVGKVDPGHCTGGGQPTCAITDPPTPGCTCEELVPPGQQGSCGCTYMGPD